MSLPAPDILAAHWAWFGASLLVSTLFAILWSPKRRAVIGSVRYIAGWWVIVAPPLFCAICVRGGYALAWQGRGEHPLIAQFYGGGVAFIAVLVLRLALMLFPPTAWLLREWRRANREASVFRRAFQAKD